MTALSSRRTLFWAEPALSGWCGPDTRAVYERIVDLRPAGNYHEKQGRSTGLYYLDGPQGPQPIYLKKYYRLPWPKRWLAPLGQFPGPHELHLLRTAAALGIQVPEPVFAGADRRHACRSFLAVRELSGFAPLHEYIPRRFSQPPAAGDGAHKLALSRRIADIARRLHAAHWHHRDFYLCHLFIRVTGSDPDAFELAMIDFGRLLHSRRARWRIKDLAELLFSADVPGITRTDRLRFLKHYLAQSRLDATSRRLARRLERKAQGYRRHNAKG
ncbi:MAG TPA: lipopolysaccharide kinase InaA family protein [Pirellulales bacterium]